MSAVPFVTIDSEHTEDMDDALYIEKMVIITNFIQQLQILLAILLRTHL